MRTGVEGCGVVVWFGKYTGIASLVLLFGLTIPAYIVLDNNGIAKDHIAALDIGGGWLRVGGAGQTNSENRPVRV